MRFVALTSKLCEPKRETNMETKRVAKRKKGRPTGKQMWKRKGTPKIIPNRTRTTVTVGRGGRTMERVFHCVGILLVVQPLKERAIHNESHLHVLLWRSCQNCTFYARLNTTWLFAPLDVTSEAFTLGCYIRAARSNGPLQDHAIPTGCWRLSLHQATCNRHRSRHSQDGAQH